MRKWILWLVFMIAVALAGFWTASRVIGTARSGSASLVLQKATVESPGDLEQFQTRLLNPAVDQPGREALIEKIEIQNREDALQKSGEENPASKTNAPEVASSKVQTELSVETGIFEGSEGMVRPEQGNIQNYWRGIVDGKIVMLMAGAKAGDDTIGLVVVITASSDPVDNQVAIDYIPALVRSGSLRVVSVKNNIANLQTFRGEILHFDVKKHEFVP